MENRKIETIRSSLLAKIEETKCKEEKLKQEAYFDDAKQQVIMGNVYQIFLTVLEVGMKQYKDENQVLIFLEHKIDDIPRQWRLSFAKANQYQNDEKVYLEQTKLDALVDVQAIYKKAVNLNE